MEGGVTCTEEVREMRGTPSTRTCGPEGGREGGRRTDARRGRKFMGGGGGAQVWRSPVTSCGGSLAMIGGDTEQ